MKKTLISLVISAAICGQNLQTPKGVTIGPPHNEPWNGKAKRKKKANP